MLLEQMSRWTPEQWAIYAWYLIQYGISSIIRGDYGAFIEYWMGM